MTASPSFSIVVPTRDRPRKLASCLAALAVLRYPSDRYEVIVVDDGSQADLEAVLAPLRDRMTLSLVAQSSAGPAAARNRGAAAARGEVLAFTDDDCRPDPAWLSSFSTYLAVDPLCGLGGRTINDLVDNRYAAASQLLIDYLFAYYGAPSRVPLYTSSNLALPRELFVAVGGFDETFRRAGGEDRELCDRWVHAGHRLRFASDALVYHAHDLDLRGFLRQQYNYGCGAVGFHRARTRRGSRRMFPEPLRFYRELVLSPFARNAERPLGLAALLAVSQMANTAGFVRELLRRGRGARPPAPAAPPQRRDATRL